MRRTAGLTLALCALAALARPTADVGALSWMEGRWTGTQGGVEMEEYWSSGAGGVMLGLHKDVKNGKVVSFEFLRIAPGEKGELTYFASPRSAPPTPFRLKESSERRVVFENAAHDFPQRILYWLDAEGALHARVEGTMGGKPAGEEWTWRRADR
jgi:hypothetical protein